MSRNARALVLALAAVALVVGFVIAQRSGDDDSDDATATATQTVAETAGAETGAADAAEPGAADDAGPPEEPEPKPPLVRVEGQQPVGGVQELVFHQGDVVDFRVRSDVDEELHVHGYDVTKALPAGKAVRVRFPADIEGRFEVELHGAHVQVARLEVQP